MHYKFRANVSFILVLLSIFHLSLLYIMPVESVPYDHTFEATSSFNFNVWRESVHGFGCPGEQQHYKLMCKFRWDTIIGELKDCLNPGLQTGGPTTIVFVCLMTMEAVIIGGLLAYSCRMRRKIKYYQEYKQINTNNNCQYM